MRFYLKESLISYDPKHVMLSCILVATKLENLHLTMSDFAGKVPNCQTDLILTIELALLEALDFNLHFFHPHSCLSGLFIDMQATIDGLNEDLIISAGKILDNLIMTDALVTETPSHLAMAAFFICAEQQFMQWADRRLSAIIEMHNLKEILVRIQSFLSAIKPLDQVKLKEVDKRLIKARNMIQSSNLIPENDRMQEE